MPSKSTASHIVTMLSAAQNPGTSSRAAMPGRAAFPSDVSGVISVVMASSSPRFEL
jgi:hypothetical protein